MKIKGVLNAAWSPQSNQVERLHKWLGAALRLLFDKYDLDVDEAAEVAIYIYRSTPCLVTKFTPYLLDKGREPRFPTDIFEGKRAEITTTEYTEHLQEVLPKIWKAAVAARMEAQEIAAEYYNERHGKPVDLVTGDLVFCEDHSHNHSDVSSKILPKCNGPWKIKQLSSKGAQLKHISTGIEKHANLRHLRKIRLTTDQLRQLGEKELYIETEILGLVPGAFVVVKTNIIGWLIAKLIETRDDDLSWNIQWFNIKQAGVSGANRLSGVYLPCWVDENGIEVRAKLQPHKTEPMTYTVRRKRFMFDPFILTPTGQLPESVKSNLRGYFKNEQLSY